MVLEAAGEALWLVEREIVSFYSFPYPTRAVTADPGGGALRVWPPAALTTFYGLKSTRWALSPASPPTRFKWPL